jgi:hypothetical protein
MNTQWDYLLAGAIAALWILIHPFVLSYGTKRCSEGLAAWAGPPRDVLYCETRPWLSDVGRRSKWLRKCFGLSQLGRRLLARRLLLSI